jgi:hypothetical protein
MPTLSRGGKEPAKFWSWLAHRPWILLLGMIVGDSLRILVFGNGGVEPNDLGFVVSSLLGTGAFAVYFMAGSRHQIGVVCEHCMAENPLDGDGEAEKHRRQLKITHVLRERWYIMLILAALILAVILMIPAGSQLLLIPAVIIWTLLALDWICMRQHQRLYPWCPFCDHGKGRGPREVAPTPTPVRTDEKILS